MSRPQVGRKLIPESILRRRSSAEGEGDAAGGEGGEAPHGGGAAEGSEE